MIRASLLVASICGCVLIGSAAAPASAQYYPSPGYDQQSAPGYYPPPAPGYAPPPAPGYPPAPRYGRPAYPPYDRDGYRSEDGYRPDGGYRRPAPQRGAAAAPPGQGLHCASSRGLCELGFPALLRAPCRCEIDGERRRGAVVP